MDSLSNYHANRICKGLVPISDKNLALAKDRHISGEAHKWPAQEHGGALAIRFDHRRQPSHGDKLMLAAIDECRRKDTAAIAEHDCPAFKEKPCERPGPLAYNDGAGNHPTSSVGPSLAFDDDRAAAHAVACALPDRAADNDNAAAHSSHFSCQRAAQSIARGAADFQHTRFHARRGPWSGIAEHRQAASRHQASGLDAEIAVDHELPVFHLLTDVIESIAGILNADLLDITCAQSKHIANFDTVAGCL